jgi:hypothetical protein
VKFALRCTLVAAGAALSFVFCASSVFPQSPPDAKFPTAAKRSAMPPASPGTPPQSEDALRDPPRFNYVLHCSGCHFMHGEGVPSGGIPRVRNQMGYFLALPEGRAYLMQVPGLLSAGMSDEDAAGVINWMVDYFAGASRPADFTPYSAEEARRYRRDKPADIIGKRRRLAEQLRAAGYPIQ